MSGNGFAGQVAIVTGASRGLGAEIARGLLEQGAKVVASGRKGHKLDALAESLGPLAPNFLGVVADQRDQESAGRLCRAAIDTFGSIELLVNNAAISPHRGHIAEIPLETFRDVLHTNVLMTWWLTAQAWQAGFRRGAILNVGTIGGVQPTPRFAAYSVSKAAVHHLTRQMAAELAPDIRANCIAPAIFESDFSTPLLDAQPDLGKRYPLGRIGSTADVARLALFLLDPASSWITGQVWPIDGGLLNQGLELD